MDIDTKVAFVLLVFKRSMTSGEFGPFQIHHDMNYFILSKTILDTNACCLLEVNIGSYNHTSSEVFMFSLNHE